LSSRSKRVKEVGDVKELDLEDIIYVIHREGDALTIAELVKELAERGLTQREIAELLGWSTQKVNYVLRLNNLPSDVKQLYREGKLSKSALYKLVRLPPEKASEVAHRVAEGEAKVEEVERIVREEIYLPSLEEAVERAFTPPSCAADTVSELLARLEAVIQDVPEPAKSHLARAREELAKALEILKK